MTRWESEMGESTAVSQAAILACATVNNKKTFKQVEGRTGTRGCLTPMSTVWHVYTCIHTGTGTGSHPLSVIIE